MKGTKGKTTTTQKGKTNQTSTTSQAGPRNTGTASKVFYDYGDGLNGLICRQEFKGSFP